MNKRLLIVILAILIGVLFIGYPNSKTLAHGTHKAPIDASYNSYIINDAAFIAKDTMSAAEIQAFLEQNVIGGSCDTWHVNPYGSTPKPPWTCLYQYRDPANGNKLASQIIYEETQSIGINPQVILVTLQKENSLIADNWPWPDQYKTAMGYACPEGSDCNAAYFGFTNQVRNGAKLFRAVYNRSCTPEGVDPYIGWTVLYRANTTKTIDGKSTYIGNCATAALYQYTPHRPDSGWLTATDGSHYYGNYNFVYYYNKWFNFGKYLTDNLPLSNLQFKDANNKYVIYPPLGSDVTISYSLTNNTGSSITIDGVGVAGRFNGQGRDLGWPSAALAAGETKNFSFTANIKDIGTISYWPSIKFDNTWYSYPGKNLISRRPDMKANSLINVSPATAIVGQTGTLSVTITNNEAVPLKYQSLVIAARLNGAGHYDTAADLNGSIAAKSTKTLSGTLTYPSSGTYTAWPSMRVGSLWINIPAGWNITYKSWEVGSPNKTNLPVSNLQFKDMNGTNVDKPAIGQDVTISYTLTNKTEASLTLDAIGLAGRFNGLNRDLGWSSVTFAKDEAKSFSFTTNIQDFGTISYSPSFSYKGKWYSYAGKNLQSRQPNMKANSLINVTPADAKVGQTATLSVIVTNNESVPIKYSLAIIAVRLNDSGNFDTGDSPSGTINARSTKTLTGTITYTASGTYKAWPSFKIGSTWINVPAGWNTLIKSWTVNK